MANSANSANYKIIVNTDSTQVAKVKHEIEQLQKQAKTGVNFNLDIDINALKEVLSTIDKNRYANHKKFLDVTNTADKSKTDLSAFVPNRKKYIQNSETQRSQLIEMMQGLDQLKLKGLTHVTEEFMQQVVTISSEVLKATRELEGANNHLLGKTKNLQQTISDRINRLPVSDDLKVSLDSKHKTLIHDAEVSGNMSELRNFNSLLGNSDKQFKGNREGVAKIGALAHINKDAFISLIENNEKDTQNRLKNYAENNIFQNPRPVSFKKEIVEQQGADRLIDNKIERFFKAVEHERKSSEKVSGKHNKYDDVNIVKAVSDLERNQSKLGSYNHGNVNASNIDIKMKELEGIVFDNDSIKNELNNSFAEYVKNNKAGLHTLFDEAKQEYSTAIGDLRKAIKSGKLSPEDLAHAETLKADLVAKRSNLIAEKARLKNKDFTQADAESLAKNDNLNTGEHLKGLSAVVDSYKTRKPPEDTFEELLARKFNELKVVGQQARAMARNTYKYSKEYRQKFYEQDGYGNIFPDTKDDFATDLEDTITSHPQGRLHEYAGRYAKSTSADEKAEIYNELKYAKTKDTAEKNLRNTEGEILRGSPVYREHIINDLSDNVKKARAYKKSLENFKNSNKLSIDSLNEVNVLISDVEEEILDYGHKLKSARTADIKKLESLKKTFSISEQKNWDEAVYGSEISRNKGIEKDFKSILRTSKTAINSGIGEARNATESNYETTKSYKVGADGKVLSKQAFGDKIKKLAIGNAEETIKDIEKQFASAVEAKDFGKIQKLTTQLQDLGLSKIIPKNIKTINSHLKDDVGIEGIIKHTQKKYQELHKKIGEDIVANDTSDLPESIKKQKREVLKEFQKTIGKELQNLTKIAKDVAGQDISTAEGAKKLGQIANNISNSNRTSSRIENDYNKFSSISSSNLNTADLDAYYTKQNKVLKNTYELNSELEHSREDLDKQTSSMKAQNKVSQDMEKEIQRLITLETQYSRTIKARESYATSASIEQARKEQLEIKKQREALEAQRASYNNMSVADRGRASNDMSAQVANSRAGAFNQQNAYGQSRADLGELTIGNRFKRIAENTAMFATFTTAVGLATGAVVALGKEFIEFDKNVAMMSALLGDGNKSVKETREEMEKLELQLMDLGTVYGGTFEEINKSALQLGRAGIQLAELQKATETALKLTKLTGGTMESSTDVLVSFITTYGKASATVEASQTNVKDIGDSLAYWSRMARGSMEDLNTFSTYALEASANAGLTTTATLALGASFNNLGMSASTAGTTTRTLMNSLGDTNPKIVAFYEKIGFSQDAMAEKFRKGGKDSEQALIQLSGRLKDISKTDFALLTKGLDTYDKHAMTSLRSASDRIEAYIKDAKKVQNELDKSKIATDNLASSWEKLVNNIKLSFHGIADWVGKMAKGMIDAINSTYDEAEKREKRLDLMTPEEREKNDPRQQLRWSDSVEALDIITGNSTGVLDVIHNFNIDTKTGNLAKAVADAINMNSGQYAIERLSTVKANIDRTKMLTTEDYGNLNTALNHLEVGASDALKAKDALLLTPESIAEIKKMQVTLKAIDKKLESPNATIKLQGAKDLFHFMGHTLKGTTNSAVAVQEMAEQRVQKYSTEGTNKKYLDDYNQLYASAKAQGKNNYSWNRGNDCSALGSSFLASRGINTTGDGTKTGTGTTTASHLTFMNHNKLNVAQKYMNMTFPEAKKAGMDFGAGFLYIVKNPKTQGKDQTWHEGVSLEDGTIAHFGSRQNIAHKNFATNGAKIVGVMDIKHIQEQQGVGNVSSLNAKYYSRPELSKNTGTMSSKPSDEGYKPLFTDTDISAIEKFDVNSKSIYKKEITKLDKIHNRLLQELLDKIGNLMNGGSFEKGDKNILFAEDTLKKLQTITKKANSKVSDPQVHEKASTDISKIQNSIDTNSTNEGDSSLNSILSALVSETKGYQDDLLKITEARHTVRELLKKDDIKDKIKELEDTKTGKLNALAFVSGNNRIDKIQNPEAYAESRDLAIKEKEIAINKEFVQQLDKLQKVEEKRLVGINKQIDAMVTEGSLDKDKAENLKKELQQRTAIINNAKDTKTRATENIDDLKQEMREYQAEATYQTNHLFRNFAEQAEQASRESFKFLFSNASPESKTKALQRKGVADKEANDEMLYSATNGRVNRFTPVTIDMDVSESSMADALNYLNEEFADTWIGRQMRNMSINTDGLDEWADAFMNSTVSQIGRHEIYIKYKNLSDTNIAKDKSIFATKDTMANDAKKNGDTDLYESINEVNIAGTTEDFQASVDLKILAEEGMYDRLLEMHRQHLENKKTQEQLFAEQENEIKRKALENNLEMGAKGFEAMGTFMNVFRNKEGKLNKQAFEAQKVMNIGQAIMNTAVGVTKAQELPVPMNYIQSALVIASGMAQVATIKQQTYHTGGAVSNDGFSNTRSDEVPALLQTGEYVLSRNDMYNIKNGTAKGSSSVAPQPVKNEVVVVNSIDPSVVEQYLTSRTGREVVQNIVRR